MIVATVVAQGTWLVALRYHARSRSGTHASTWPVSLRSCLNAATRGAIPAADLRLDYRRRRLLRARRERPRSHAAEQRDELAPSQWIELHSNQNMEVIHHPNYDKG